jgi:hypothetical protein
MYVSRKKKIEGQGNGFLIGCAAMQSIEIRNAIARQMDNLGVNNHRRTKPIRFLHDTGIALGPIISDIV